MTEEIIIDGVNVAECEFYYEGECCQTNYKNEIFTKRCKCSDKLCYYKQLKRLEQENKKLKEYKIEHKYSNAEYRQERESVIQLSYYRNRYRSALEEIRKMCKRQNFNQGMRTFEILKFINEVLK